MAGEPETTYSCPCGQGEEPFPGPDGRPLCDPKRETAAEAVARERRIDAMIAELRAFTKYD